jgi:hypothetical protein
MIFLLFRNFFPSIYLVLLFGFMVFNATFNNISVISWRSVLLVEETGETILSKDEINKWKRDRRGRDRMVVGFTTDYAIGAYHH